MWYSELVQDALFCTAEWNQTSGFAATARQKGGCGDEKQYSVSSGVPGRPAPNTPRKTAVNTTAVGAVRRSISLQN